MSIDYPQRCRPSGTYEYVRTPALCAIYVCNYCLQPHACACGAVYIIIVFLKRYRHIYIYNIIIYIYASSDSKARQHD